MSTLPAAGSFTAESRTEEEACNLLNDFLSFVRQSPGGNNESTLTIASGRVVPTRYLHTIDTEGAAASDNLDLIGTDNLPLGSFLSIRCVSGSRPVTVRHLQGTAEQIFLADAQDFTLASSATRLILYRTSAQWLQFGPPLFASDKTAFRSWLALAYATQIEAQAGSSLFRIMPPGRMADWFEAYAPGKVPYGRFTSPQLTIGNAVHNEVDHELGGTPTLVTGTLECISADGIWNPGDTIPIHPLEDRAITLWATSTQVGYYCAAKAQPVSVITLGGTIQLLTNAKWRLKIRAWL